MAAAAVVVVTEEAVDGAAVVVEVGRISVVVGAEGHISVAAVGVAPIFPHRHVSLHRG